MTLYGASIAGHTGTSWPTSRVAATRSAPFLEHPVCGLVVSGSIGCIALTKVWLRTSWGGVFFHVIKGTYVPGTNLQRSLGADPRFLPSTSGNGPPQQPHSDDDQAKPKLRCSAGECRALVPFLVDLAESVLSNDLLDEAVSAAARILPDC